MNPSTSQRPTPVARPLVWVESMGGPLIAVPVSALSDWGGCTGSGTIAGSGDVVDDYDRACEVEDLAGVTAVGPNGAHALLLADEPATSCWLPEHRAFLRWLGADSEADLLAAAEAVLADPSTAWEECGTWETDGPAILMDSAEAGDDLNVEYADGSGFPEQAPVPLPTGRWTVRAVHTRAGDHTSLGLVKLVPADS
ncbi:Imm21 family immunity protein [Streptomyces sp. NPDC002688]|uniref:Imm21 family immunity protein n=1 Tax=Streptomyces sp. NPDC002688 TaxID=3154423 RepID=UPI0033170D26